MKFKRAAKPQVYPLRYVKDFGAKYNFIRLSSLKGCGSIGCMLHISDHNIYTPIKRCVAKTWLPWFHGIPCCKYTGDKNCHHFEICNASPDCNSIPIPDFALADNRWDELLTAGFHCYGLANEDPLPCPKDTQNSSAGRGHSVVNALTLPARNILKAINSGTKS